MQLVAEPLHRELQAGGGRLRMEVIVGDASALAKLLMDIAQDADRYRTDHAPSRDIFHRLFDADKVMEDFANHLESLAVRGTGNTRPSR